MSEPASLGVKKDPKDVSSKQLVGGGSSFPNLNDDGFPAGPSLKSPTPAEDTTFLSDDDTKTLTMLEPVKKAAGGAARKSFPAAAKVVQKHSNVHRIIPEKIALVDNGKEKKTLDKESFPNDSIIEKMRSKLSKQIDRTPLKPAPGSPPLDMSGAIEIPQDLILSNDIPQTPIAAPDTKESKLDDHDLIAILEGNVVAIRENASEIEVCVGTEEAKEAGEEMEVLSFAIINPDELEHAKKEREKEIARRQMESLPLLPKVRKPRTKTVPKRGANQPDALVEKYPIEVKQTPVPVIKLPPGITIKGQTTIKPLVKIPLDSGLTIKKEPQPPEAVKGTLSKNIKEKLPKDLTLSTVPVKKTVNTPDASPDSSPKKSQLVDSLVSDWDDEPAAQRHDVEDAPMLPENQLPTSAPMHETPMESDGQKQFIPPSPIAEPKRLIKRKIIWDPSDSSIPFASLVKSNRAQSTNLNANPPTNLIPLRRKRADSVAVRMIDNTPQFSMVEPVRQRAKTPELGLVIERETVPPMVAKGEELTNDLKAKKRKKNEIERLLGDEGAINMLYDVECETNRKDLLKATEVDTSDEDEKLLAKTKIITDVVINQGKSPNESTAPQGLRIRTKRSTTPMNQVVTSPTSVPQNNTKASVSQPTSSGSVNSRSVKKPTNGTTSVPPITGARKRKMTASAAKEWEYVYNAQRNDDAMIIRRRSNSSYSSGASPRRLSFDQTNESGTGFGSENSTSPQSASNSKASNPQPPEEGFLFAKPPNKNEPQRTVTKPPGTATIEEIKFNPSLVANMRGKLTKVLKGMKMGPLATSTPGQDEPSKGNKQPVKRKPTPSESVDVVDSPSSSVDVLPTRSNVSLQKQLEQLKEMTCVRQGNYAEIVLSSKGVFNEEGGNSLTNVFSQDLMHGLINALAALQRDSTVRAVLIRSAGEHFSRGLDVGHLIQPAEKRKEIAEEMSACVMKFLRVIINFPKPIVAAVHGDVLGMGVTILPIFDLVVAQMGTSFTAPYGHFGYLPEGMGAFTGCRTLKGKTVTDLFLQGKRLTATVALDYGLVTETVPPERFEDRARSVAKTIASQSVQAMQSIKQHLRRDLIAKLETILWLEKKKHSEQWVTAECQQKFKLFVSKKGEL
ncbi:uncharacterized protein LOC128711513 [Anopheles marshallii]|uniref:uncharacterized protein LOC128711513 n=1 Tax=Anopheles marshallii TaxID=1521116 RepID=UPI00237AC6DF|nr:uncharacterized protein LOC128711513 [Anopheles marshallii]